MREVVFLASGLRRNSDYYKRVTSSNRKSYFCNNNHNCDSPFLPTHSCHQVRRHGEWKLAVLEVHSNASDEVIHSHGIEIVLETGPRWCGSRQAPGIVFLSFDTSSIFCFVGLYCPYLPVQEMVACVESRNFNGGLDCGAGHVLLSYTRRHPHHQWGDR